MSAKQNASAESRRPPRVDDVDTAAAAAPEAVAPPAEELVYFQLSGTEGEPIRISQRASEQSKTISDLVFGLEFTAENAAHQPVIPINNIKHATLLKIVEWCEKHKGEPVPVEDQNYPKQTALPEWDAQFLEMEDQELFDLVIAANYLDIKRLLTYACKKIALMAVGKTPEELRVIFEIPTDEEDEAAEKKRMEKEAAEKGEEPSTSGASTSTQ